MKKKTVITTATAALLVAAAATVTINTALADDVDTNIIGGEPASEDYEFVGSVQRQEGDNPDHHGCAATLVEPTKMVTAAHCVVDENNDPLDPSERHIRIGSTNRLEGEKIELSSLTVHPEYGEREDWSADIAVLELAEEASQTPLEIPAANPEVGDEVRTIGWGYTDPDHTDDPSKLPEELRELDTSILDIGECDFGDEWSAGDGDLCGDIPGGDSGPCNGDSGGPLLQEIAGEWAFVGITSRSGDGCVKTPEVYTSPVDFEEFIASA